MNAPLVSSPILGAADSEAVLRDLAGRLRAGVVAPYLGPGVFASATPEAPMAPETLAEFFAGKVALPKRAKGNAWAAAQYIESMKHRSTVTALMVEAFSRPAPPTALHLGLAALRLPLIVDTWYDGAMRAALADRADWGEAQGISRAGIGEDRWYRFYNAAGEEVAAATANAWTTLLYKPHGAIVPAKNFLISDADYVETLTEIDIQTPIPEIVKDRRAERTFLFLGCRFHDQMLRTYARQVIKRSTARHYVVVEPERLTKNELRFFDTQGMVPLAVPLDRAAEILTTAA